MQPTSRFWRLLFPNTGIYIASFLILFIFGTLGGMAMGSIILDREKQPQKLAVRSLSGNNNGQHNYLLIGVDEIKPTGANLDSIWLLIAMTGSSKLIVIPIYPAESTGSGISEIVPSSSIEFTSDLTPQESYLNQLREKFWWDAYFMVDRTGYRLISEIFENALTEEPGLEAFLQDDEIREKLEKFSAPLKTQVTQMLILCDRYGKYPYPFEFERLSRILDSHFITDINLEQIEQNNLENHQNMRKTGCEFPTLNLTIP